MEVGTEHCNTYCFSLRHEQLGKHRCYSGVVRIFVPKRKSSMLDKCANSDCSAVFHRLRDGRLFAFDLRVIQGRATGSHSGPKTHGHQYHWLCNECCKTMTLASKDGSTVTVVPKQPISTPSRLP